MIALVDCNNFFASCERLFRPDLKTVPVLVLSNNDGCVVARSNEVRELGVPMGIPYFQIRELVEKNNIRCFSSNFALYSNISQRIIGVLAGHAPQIEVYSIDEAFMDLSSLPTNNFQEWGDNLQKEILQNIGMPVSVGVAPTKTLAKLASSYAKKHNQACVLDLVRNQELYEKVLNEAQVGDVWGVGRKLTQRLQAVGVRTALQLSKTSDTWLQAQLGVNGVRTARELRGMVAYPFDERREPQKSLMASRSFGHVVKSAHQLEVAVASFASQAAYRLRAQDQVTSNFGLYLRMKTPDGLTKSHVATTNLIAPTNDTVELVSAALALMERLYDPDNGYKKAGVFASRLSSARVCQVDLFDVLSPKARQRRRRFMGAVDSINQRFGSDTIHVGTIDKKADRWRGKIEQVSPAYTTDWRQLPLVHNI